jgi:hypothetical protein
MRAPEHPAPWRWVSKPNGRSGELEGRDHLEHLADGSGKPLLWLDDGRGDGRPPPRIPADVLALIAAAPEMEALLRNALNVCEDDDGRLPHIDPDAIRALLARIDAAKGG